MPIELGFPTKLHIIVSDTILADDQNVVHQGPNHDQNYQDWQASMKVELPGKKTTKTTKTKTIKTGRPQEKLSCQVIQSPDTQRLGNVGVVYFR